VAQGEGHEFKPQYNNNKKINDMLPRNGKNNPKIHVEAQKKTQIAKAILCKKSNPVGITIPNFKSYCRVIVV
jgi:hypothetical protein